MQHYIELSLYLLLSVIINIMVPHTSSEYLNAAFFKNCAPNSILFFFKRRQTQFVAQTQTNPPGLILLSSATSSCHPHSNSG